MLLFNMPSGLAYFDQIYGFNLWLPLHLIDPSTGAALPLILEGKAWEFLSPTPIDWGQQYVPLANITYAFLNELDPTDFAFF